MVVGVLRGRLRTIAGLGGVETGAALGVDETDLDRCAVRDIARAEERLRVRPARRRPGRARRGLATVRAARGQECGRGDRRDQPTVRARLGETVHECPLGAWCGCSRPVASGRSKCVAVAPSSETTWPPVGTDSTVR